MSIAIASFLVATVLATAAAGGTYALLNSSAQASAPATITSGTATLAIAAPLTLPTTPLYPGLRIYGAVTVRNTGDVPLALRIAGLTQPTASTSADFLNSLTIGVGIATSPDACTNGSTASAWTGTFASAPTATIGSPLPLNGTVVLCVSVAMSTAALNTTQGQSVTNFGLLIDGTQV